MSTKNYNLPEIDPSAKFNGAEDINNLANEIDKQMKIVEQLGKDSHYTLTPATKSQIGGVIIGDGINVKSDGTISVAAEKYELPPASSTTLGGVIVPKDSGFNLTTDGEISIDTASVNPGVNSIKTDNIVDSAVTNIKIADEAIDESKLNTSLKEVFEKSLSFTSGQLLPVDVTLDSGISGSITCSVFSGIFYFIHFSNIQFVGNNSTSISLAKIGGANLTQGSSYPASLLPLYVDDNIIQNINLRLSNIFANHLMGEVKNNLTSDVTYTLSGDICLYAVKS